MDVCAGVLLHAYMLPAVPFVVYGKFWLILHASKDKTRKLGFYFPATYTLFEVVGKLLYP